MARRIRTRIRPIFPRRLARLLRWLGGGLGFVWTSWALAYVLPSGGILRRTAERREAVVAGGLRIEGSLILAGETAQAAAAPLGLSNERPELTADGVLTLKLPGRCRLEVSAPSAQAPLVAASSHGKQRTEGTAIEALGVAVQEVCGVLATRTGEVADTRAELARHLGTLKVAQGRSSLARFGGQVTYLLGDVSEGASQLWVYKDAFQPARVRFTDAGGATWDVRFLDYGSAVMGDSFPRVVEVFRNGAPALRWTALSSDVRSNLSDRLF